MTPGGSPGEGFTFRDGERVIRFGADVLADAPAELERAGFDGYALLTTERGLADAPAGIEDSADVMLHVPPGPVPEAAAAVRGAVAGRPLVALGGGRVVDAAKAITAADGGRVAAIPTTLAGSSFTPFHRMPAGVEGYGLTRPALALCEPETMTSAPMPGLAASAMNALAHATEALYAPGANPVSEGAALRAASLFARGFAADLPARSDIALAAVLAGWAVGTAGLAVHHAVCQTIVRSSGTPHAETNAVMLPHSVAFMAGRAPAAITALASALGREGVDEAAPAVASLSALAGPVRLSELGVAADEIDGIVTGALEHPGVAATPGGVTREDLRALLDAALRGALDDTQARTHG